MPLWQGNRQAPSAPDRRASVAIGRAMQPKPEHNHQLLRHCVPADAVSTTL